MKKKSLNILNPEILEEYLSLYQNFFEEDSNGVITLGGVKIDHSIRSVLKDEADYIQRSKIWEIISSTIVNESYNISLKQSANWEHVLSAKQLYHWNYVMKKILHAFNK